MYDNIIGTQTSTRVASTLPVELLRQILLVAFPSPPLFACSDMVAERYAELRRCCLVNQSWRDVCQELLLEDVAIFDVERVGLIRGLLKDGQVGQRVKTLRIGDSRRERKQSCAGDDWHELLDLVPTVQRLFVSGLWISSKGESVTSLRRSIGFDELVRPSKPHTVSCSLFLHLLNLCSCAQVLKVCTSAGWPCNKSSCRWRSPASPC